MNNRQAGRRRGRGGQRPGGNSGGRDNGNRIDNRSRGNAAQLLEKYKSLAADAQRSGDRVNTEYYLQFADHYFRVLAETRSRFDEQRRPGDDDGDDEFGYEGEIASPANQLAHDDRGDRAERGNERQYERADRGDRQGGERSERQPERNERYAERPDRAERPERPERPERNNNRREGRRDERPRDASEGDDAPRVEARSEPRGDVRSEPREERPAPVPTPANDEPRRRGRPRREVAPVQAEIEPAGFDAALLPPSLGIDSSSASNDGEEAPRPRRRRVRAREDEEMTPPAA
jgi:hypothetical protein